MNAIAVQNVSSECKILGAPGHVDGTPEPFAKQSRSSDASQTHGLQESPFCPSGLRKNIGLLQQLHLIGEKQLTTHAPRWHFRPIS